MSKAWARLSSAMLFLTTACLAATGCSQDARRDLKESFIHLNYYDKRDMRSTVAIKPQKALPRPPDSLSVPVSGRERMPSRDLWEATLQNPVPYSAAAFDSGASHYRRMCVPCHGASLKGDGLVAPKFIPPPDLLGKSSRDRTDGFIYTYIRQGGAVMPSYGAQLSSAEAWELIHYIREMQKRTTR